MFHCLTMNTHLFLIAGKLKQTLKFLKHFENIWVELLTFDQEIEKKKNIIILIQFIIAPSEKIV